LVLFIIGVEHAIDGMLGETKEYWMLKLRCSWRMTINLKQTTMNNPTNPQDNVHKAEKSVEDAAKQYCKKHGYKVVGYARIAFEAGAEFNQSRIAELEAENQKYREALERIDSLGMSGDKTGAACFIECAELAEQALKKQT
jgi:predicted Fe-Mo cluster-binding NifX family protein